VVKKNTEFRFFQWLLHQFGVTEGQSNVDVTFAVKIEAVHSCLRILQEFDVVEVEHDIVGGAFIKHHFFSLHLTCHLVDHS